MSKAVLVLDEMPKTCFECELCEQRDIGRFYCASTGDPDGVGDKKPDWCPLRELPERREVENTTVIMRDAEAANRSTLQQIGYNRGWNACLDELEAEHE